VTSFYVSVIERTLAENVFEHSMIFSSCCCNRTVSELVVLKSCLAMQPDGKRMDEKKLRLNEDASQ